MVCIGSIWLRIETGGGSCEHGNEPFFSLKGGEFLHSLSVLLAFQEGLRFV
jgi:hypothetical protein